MNDLIADLVVRIKNANKAKLPNVKLYTSNLVSAILNVLKKEGYVVDFKTISKNNKKLTILELKYKNLTPTINGIKQISKPGLRVYQEYRSLPKVLNGLGTAIVSTSKGVKTDKEAREMRLGGEVLIYIW